MHTIDYYFLIHSPKSLTELLTPKQIEEYKKAIIETLKTSPLLEPEIDITIRQKHNFPIYPTDIILK